MIAAHSARLVRGWGSFIIPGTHEGATLLLFPSTNSAAHTPAPKDVARLTTLLNDDVWAFTNCRVDAAGFPVAEVDWFFYNTQTGCLMVSEWKRFPSPVSFAADTGKPWLLADGTGVSNPVEQVTKQHEVVRLAIRRSTILAVHFPGFDDQQLKLAQCVYSPQVDSATVVERIRFGKVYGTLEELASVVQTLPSPVPLHLPDDDGARLPLAKALCALFRCSMSAEVEAKLRPTATKAPPTRAAVVRRIGEIHREIAKLHLELAELTLAAEGAIEPASIRPASTQPTSIKPIALQAVQPAVQKPSTQLTESERMSAHLSRAFRGVNGSADAAKDALGKAWIAALRDPALHGKNGISLAAFGSAATPLVKAKHESVRKLVGMQLGKWCLLQAEQSGLKAMAAPGNPSNIRLRSFRALP